MTTLNGMAQSGVHSPIQSAGQDGCVPNKWQLLRVIEDIRGPLGLKSTSLSILRAMLSFLQTDHLSPSQDDAHICFASNAALANRAHVSVQTVERHVSKLVSIGLLRRRSSGNGKRWARRDGAGGIVMATGLSLLPLVERHATFVAMAQAHQASQRALALLRDRCSAALAQLRAIGAQGDLIADLSARAKQMMRRKPDAAALQDLLVKITVHIPVTKAVNAEEMRDRAPENEGHKETGKTPIVKKETNDAIKVSSDQMQRSFPKLCAELRFAQTAQACERSMDELATHLDLGQLNAEIKELGPALRFMILGYLLERIETIKVPRAYATRLLHGLRAGTLSWQSLLRHPQRRAQNAT